MYFYSSHLILLKIQPIRNTFCDTHFRTPFQSLTGVLQKPTMRINHCLGEQNWNTPVQLWQWLEVVWYDSEDTPGYRISDPLFIGIYITQIHMDFRWIDRAKSACTAAVDRSRRREFKGLQKRVQKWNPRCICIRARRTRSPREPRICVRVCMRVWVHVSAYIATFRNKIQRRT